MVIDDRGLFPEADAAEFAQFGELLRQAFGTPIASISQMHGNSCRLALPEGSNVKYLVMMEDISQGERVLAFTVNGSIAGKCVGHKRIIALPPDTQEVILEITQAKAEPVMRCIAVY